MKWSHLGLLAALLVVLIGLSAQTQPVSIPFSGGATGATILSPAFITSSAGQLAWSSSTPATSTTDAGIARLGAASLTVTNGSTGKASWHTEGTALALAIPAGGIGVGTVSTTSVGNTGQGGRLVLVCGPTAGTGSLLFYAGTSNTPVTLANAVGGGLIGC